jgi:hypothetical protein
MILISQSEGLIGKLVSLLTSALPGINPEAVKSIPEGIADAGSGEACSIGLENEEKIWIAPADGNGYFLCLMTTYPKGPKGKLIPDSKRVYVRDISEIEAKIKELTS